MKRYRIVFLLLFLAAITIIGLFLWYLSFSSISDLSDDIRFKGYLNKPLVIKQTSILQHSPESVNRFSAYSVNSFYEDSTTTEVSFLKKYATGDTIIFTSAKGYYSNHVGDTYYLLGKEKLDSGEIIEFEYYAGFDYTPAIWETLDEFLERRKLENKTSN